MAVYKIKSTGQWASQVYDRASKKKVHLGTYATKREAVAAERDYKDRPPMSAMTVDQWRAHWLDTATWKPSTKRHNAERTLAFNREHGGLRLGDVTRSVARDWIGRHPSSQGALSAMFGAAMYEDDERGDPLVRTNPFSRLQRRVQARRDLQPEWLRADDIAALERAAMRACTDPMGKQAAAMVRFAAETGVRPGELFVITWEDVLEDTLLVRRAIDSKSGVIGTPKNKREREVFLSAAAREAAQSMPPRLGVEFVFAGPTGRPLRTTSFNYYWRQVRAAAGRPGMEFYELRHYCATRLLEAGMSDADVALQLGHTDGGELVRRVYGHPSARSAMDRLRRGYGEGEAA